MVRAILGLGLLVSFVGFTGCTMCCHQNYRCGPVYDQGCQCGCPSGRAGSILEGGGCQGGCQAATAGSADLSAKHGLKWGDAAGSELTGSRKTDGQSVLLKKGDAAGSERTMAAEDRIVKPAIARKPAEKTVARTNKPTKPAEPVEESADDAPETSPRQGQWTARRPDSPSPE